jgi:hypothetical protein
MYPTADQSLAIFVTGMFMVGIVLIIHWKRQRSRTRQQWSNVPRAASQGAAPPRNRGGRRL